MGSLPQQPIKGRETVAARGYYSPGLTMAQGGV